MITRRGIIQGLISLAAAPAIVRASSLMPVRVMEPVLRDHQISTMEMIAPYEGPYNCRCVLEELVRVTGVPRRMLTGEGIRVINHDEDMRTFHAMVYRTVGWGK